MDTQLMAYPFESQLQTCQRVFSYRSFPQFFKANICIALWLLHDLGSLFPLKKFYMCSFECEGDLLWIVIGKYLAGSGCGLSWLCYCSRGHSNRSLGWYSGAVTPTPPRYILKTKEHETVNGSYEVTANRITMYLYRSELTFLPSCLFSLFSLAAEKNAMNWAVWVAVLSAVLPGPCSAGLISGNLLFYHKVQFLWPTERRKHIAKWERESSNRGEFRTGNLQNTNVGRLHCTTSVGC